LKAKSASPYTLSNSNFKFPSPVISLLSSLEHEVRAIAATIAMAIFFNCNFIFDIFLV
jgi:hypothetical protein